MKESVACGLVFIAFILLRFILIYPKMWHRFTPIVENLFVYSQHILYWGSLIAGLALCFISNINIGFLALGCFLCFYTMSLAVLSLKRIPILDNELATIIGIISLILGLTLFFITSAKHGFIALGSVLLTFLIVRFLMRIEIVFTKKKLVQQQNRPESSWPTYPSGHSPNEGKCGWHLAQGYKEHLKKSRDTDDDEAEET